MATNPRPTDVDVLEGESRSDVKALYHHIKENPLMYAGALAFIIVCAVAGTMYRMSTNANSSELTSEYARALKIEDPAERTEALAPIAEKASPLQPEVLYMKGESAFAGQLYTQAEEAFEQLRANHPDFGFTPDAVEGMGFVALEREDFPIAVERFEEVSSKWPQSFAALRQPNNVGRAQEAAGKYDAAIAAYREQLERFPQSNVARHAQEALDRLRETHPDLFPEEALVSVGEETEIDLLAPLETEVESAAPEALSESPETP